MQDNPTTEDKAFEERGKAQGRTNWRTFEGLVADYKLLR